MWSSILLGTVTVVAYGCDYVAGDAGALYGQRNRSRGRVELRVEEECVRY